MQHKTLEEAMTSWWGRKNEPVSIVTEEEQLIMNYMASIQEKLPEDKVNRPNHYTHGGIETIDYLKAKMTKEEFIGFCKGNIIKYISREAHKGGTEDMKKAAWYLNKLIEASQ